MSWQLELAGEITNVLAKRAGFKTDDLQPIDLFDAVQRIYEDSKAGRIAELHFECGSGATRIERLRRRGRELDLRKEAYHRAGVNADDIDPYYVATAWPHDAPDDEEDDDGKPRARTEEPPSSSDGASPAGASDPTAA